MDADQIIDAAFAGYNKLKETRKQQYDERIKQLEFQKSERLKELNAKATNKLSSLRKESEELQEKLSLIQNQVSVIEADEKSHRDDVEIQHADTLKFAATEFQKENSNEASAFISSLKTRMENPTPKTNETQTPIQIETTSSTEAARAESCHTSAVEPQNAPRGDSQQTPRFENGRQSIKGSDVAADEGIVEFPKQSKAFYVLRCYSCGKTFARGSGVLSNCISHVNQSHGHLAPLDENTVVEKCGLRISDATAEWVAEQCGARHISPKFGKCKRCLKHKQSCDYQRPCQRCNDAGLSEKCRDDEAPSVKDNIFENINFVIKDNLYVSPACMAGVPVEKITESSPYWDMSWISWNDFVQSKKQEFATKKAEIVKLQSKATQNPEKAKASVNGSIEGCHRGLSRMKNELDQLPELENFIKSCEIHPNQLLNKQYLSSFDHNLECGLLIGLYLKCLKSYLGRLALAKERGVIRMKAVDWFRHRLAQLIDKCEDPKQFRLRTCLRDFGNDPEFVKVCQLGNIDHKKINKVTTEAAKNDNMAKMNSDTSKKGLDKTTNDRKRDSVSAGLEDLGTRTKYPRKSGQRARELIGRCEEATESEEDSGDDDVSSDDVPLCERRSNNGSARSSNGGVKGRTRKSTPTLDKPAAITPSSSSRVRPRRRIFENEVPGQPEELGSNGTQVQPNNDTFEILHLKCGGTVYNNQRMILQLNQESKIFEPVFDGSPVIALQPSLAINPNEIGSLAYTRQVIADDTLLMTRKMKPQLTVQFVNPDRADAFSSRLVSLRSEKALIDIEEDAYARIQRYAEKTLSVPTNK